MHLREGLYATTKAGQVPVCVCGRVAAFTTGARSCRLVAHVQNAARLIYCASESAGKAARCPLCGQRISVPQDSQAGNDNPVTLPCPRCNNPLRLVRQLYGKRVRCNACGNVLMVSGDPRQLSLVGGNAVARPGAAAAVQPLHPALKNRPSPSTAGRSIQEARQPSSTPAGGTEARTGPSSRADGETVAFRCPRCSKVLNARKHLAGKALACSCGCNVQIPGSAIGAVDCCGAIGSSSAHYAGSAQPL